MSGSGFGFGRIETGSGTGIPSVVLKDEVIIEGIDVNGLINGNCTATGIVVNVPSVFVSKIFEERLKLFTG